MAQTFARTNEDLPSIVRGMDVNPSDYILAVGGSGDQAFALLEYAKKVKTVDKAAIRSITLKNKRGASRVMIAKVFGGEGKGMGILTGKDWPN